MLTQEKLKEELDYNPNTGEFRWKPKDGIGGHRSKCGSVVKKGYLCIKIGGTHGSAYLAHRLAWLYVCGFFPECLSGVVHHINGVKNDNRIDNLMVLSGSDQAKLHTSGKFG